jgi:UDP-glucose 4-epimerase
MNIVMIGGNGYIGGATTQAWMKADPDAVFYVVSRSGKNELKDPRIHNFAADVTNHAEVDAILPEQVDYIVDFAGGLSDDPEEFRKLNNAPADAMLQIAREKGVRAMGYIGGILGSKEFVNGKKAVADKLRASGIRTVVVNPTLVYGNGRNDKLAKMVPFLKFCGIFSKKMKPVTVEEVANEMVSGMRQA